MTQAPKPSLQARIQLPEVIDERVDLAVLFGKTRPNLRISCANVKRINSVGLRGLKATLARLEREGAQLVFEAITPPLIEAIDFISNLIPAHSRIESVFVPYCCTACMQNFLVLYPFDQLKEKQSEIEYEKCVNCGKVARFDHMPELYFGNLFGSGED